MLPATSGGRRPQWLRALLPVCLGLVIIPMGGCGDRDVKVSVQQPIAFPHQIHLDYFSSGRHPREGIERHLKLLDLAEADAPESLPGGDCLECHTDNMAEKTACVGCHMTFQDANLRAQKDLRRCVACHRGTWEGSKARLPSVAVCTSCHNAESAMTITDAAAEKKLQADLAREEDVPWVQINTVAPDVYFSHPAHVRYQSLACTTCHTDVTTLTSPPTTARVFTMNSCLKCHVDNGGAVSCLTCHK